MKKKVIVVLLSLAAIVGTFFALRAILSVNDAYYLVMPGHSLVWHSVVGADSYEVEVGGEARITSRPRITLKYEDNGKAVRVRALAKGSEPSEFTEAFAVSFSKETLNGNTVTYGLAQLNISRKEFIERGEPISVAPEDYTGYGYEFLYWYISGDTLKQPQKSPIIALEAVVLLAEVRPIDYPVTFVFTSGFMPPQNIPSTYNVENISSLLSVKAEYRGYKIDGWSTSANGVNVLTANSVLTGPLTLYPRVSLMSEGLSFEPCDGGYALKGYTGSGEKIFVPDIYAGMPVVKVLSGAINGENAPNLKCVEFYGDIYFSQSAVRACPKLERLIFNGDFSAEENSVYVAGTIGEENAVLAFEIHGELPANAAFISGYLGFPPEKQIVFYVEEEYYSEAQAAFSPHEVKMLSES